MVIRGETGHLLNPEYEVLNGEDGDDSRVSVGDFDQGPG